MRTQLAVLVAAVALAPVPLTGLPAGAAGATCQGKEPTIVDTDGGEVQGTDADDVIVVQGYDADVTSLAGDDTVCLNVRLVLVNAGPGRDSVQARGTGDSGVVALRNAEDLDVVVPGGPLATVRLEFTRGGTGVIDFGRGGGDLHVFNRRSVDVDLEGGVMALDAKASSYQVRGVRNVTASARRVTVVGDRRKNLLYVVNNACRTVMKGGRGEDSLGVDTNNSLPRLHCGENAGTRLLGQRGDDFLQGRYRDDVLIGGPGRDHARGARGSDKCRAERVENCER